ncbi:GIY-YIG nuclease family protein [Candidatus Omnitrophota bacterium]
MKPRAHYWVYMVECRNGTYYTGYTNNLEKRIEKHNQGKGAKYTRDRRPVKLVWCKEYMNFRPAFLEDKRIKRLNRKQKEELVNRYEEKKQCPTVYMQTFG